MLIDKAHLLGELESLQEQRVAAQVNLAVADGAIQMVKHLLAVLDAPNPDEGEEE